MGLLALVIVISIGFFVVLVFLEQISKQLQELITLHKETKESS